MRIEFKIPYPKTKEGKTEWNKQYSLNKYYSGKNKYCRAKDANFWHEMVHFELRKQGIKRKIISEPVYIIFLWNDRLDIDNHAVMGKFIVDALKGWILENDGYKNFQGVSHFFHKEQYIQVIITNKINEMDEEK